MKKNRRIILLCGLVLALVLLSACDAGGWLGPKAITPVRKKIIDAVFASGYTINSDEYIVATNTEGFILKSFVKEGDDVKIGDLLFKLSSNVQSSQLNIALAQYKDAMYKADPNSPQILSLKTQINQSEAQEALDKKNLERYAALVKTNAVSQLEYDNARMRYETSQSNTRVLEKSLNDLQNTLALNLKNAGDQLKIQQDQQNDYLIKSTQNGKILQIYKEQGELAKRGEYLAKIGGGKIQAKLFVAEEDIHLVKDDQKVIIALNTDEAHPYPAVVSKIFPSFDTKEQSFIVHADFTDKPEKIFDNTQLQANIIVTKKDSALVIPVEYLNGNQTVTLANGHEVKVKTGIKTANWVEILSGINESNRIIERD